jgi:hypothetical protein
MMQETDAPVPQLIADLYRSDEQTGGRPTLSADQVGPARAYLEQLLLDLGNRFPQHLAALERLYGASYRAPLPRSLRGGETLPAPAVPAEFRHSAALAEPLAQAVVEGGVDRLPESELARLLLNPHALWDLDDRIATAMPDYWLRRMQDVGIQLARESGIDPYEGFEAVVGDAPAAPEGQGGAGEASDGGGFASGARPVERGE